MAIDINAIQPLLLQRDMVRSVFPVDQTLTSPALSALAGLVGRWNLANGVGTPVTVTYGFSATAPTNYTPAHVTDVNSFTAYTADEKAALAGVLAAYQAVAGISFQLVADSAAAQMVFRKVSLDVSGFAYYPPQFTELASAGDAYFPSAIAGQSYIQFHEIGHAIGLGRRSTRDDRIPKTTALPAAGFSPWSTSTCCRSPT